MNDTPNKDEPHDVIQKHLGDPSTPDLKTVTLSLTYYSNNYKVTACNNTALYKPGDWLSEQAVTQICALPNWQVLTVDNDMVASAFAFIKGLLPTFTL